MSPVELHIAVSESFAKIQSELESGNVDVAIRLAARFKREHNQTATYHALQEESTRPLKLGRSEDRRQRFDDPAEYARDYEAREVRGLIR